MNKDEQFSDFTIQKVISTQGGFADIYAATWNHDNSVVALKVLRAGGDEIVRHLFHNECQILAKMVNHPHIVGYRASGIVGDKHFLAMEMMHGDFGIAYSPGEPNPGRRLGIDKYRSLEQQQQKRSDPRSDQYSLALSYFNFLTGRQFVRHLTEDMPDPNQYGGKDIPLVCVKVLRRMLARDISQRFALIEQPLSVLKHDVLKRRESSAPSAVAPPPSRK